PDQDTLQGDASALPDVTGQSVGDAQAALEAAGFEVQVADPIDGIQASGLVEYTAPGAGSLVTTDTPIIIYPSNGALSPDAEPAETTAPEASGTWPNLASQSIGEARTTLSGAGFNPDLMQVTWQDHGAANLCTVLAQNPLPDTPGGPDDPI